MSEVWAVERRTGTAAELHHRPLGPVVSRTLTVLHVPRPALVLGSTQPDTDVDEVAAVERDVEVARRRSGGGAVLLVPEQSLWFDVDLPRHDALWDDDVGRSTHWLGHAWVRALDALDALEHRAVVHTGAMVSSTWSRLVCFAGVGPGEVLVGSQKLVGISQRRTRDGARFQCVVHRRWEPSELLDLLALDDGRRAEARTALDGVGTGLDVGPVALADALVHALPV